MSLDTQIQQIEQIAAHYIKNKDKKSFASLHGKIGLAIFDELPKESKKRYDYDAQKTQEILEKFNDSREKQSSKEENTQNIIDFFSKMVIIYSNTLNKNTKTARSLIDLFKGFVIFGLSVCILWSIFFLLTFGWQQIVVVSIVICSVLAVVLFKFDKINEGGA